jgi:hypothetical protein
MRGAGVKLRPGNLIIEKLAFSTGAVVVNLSGAKL